jgi:Bifunctional DNA primase/polymerase, N-terminal/AAA domain
MTEVYAAGYEIYRNLGWAGTIKLKARTKGQDENGKSTVPAGYTGRGGVDPSGADCHTWAQEEPDGNLALRMPDGMIGIDVDHYLKGDTQKCGGDTIADREIRWGRLPYSPRSTSRQEDGDTVSGIRLYRVPAGVEFIGKLPGVEIIQRHHRVVVCWPSIHPEGRQYRWYGIDGTELDEPPHIDDIPDLPPAWVEGLRVATNGDTLGAEFDVDESIVAAAITDGEMSQRVVFKLSLAMAELHQPECRHDAIRDRVLGLLRCGKQNEPGVKVALQALREAFANKVGPDRPGGRAEAIAEFNDMVWPKSKEGRHRIAAKLADPKYDDWDPTRNLGEPPPDVEDHHAGDYTPSDDAEPDADKAKTPVLADLLLTRSALRDLPKPEPLIDNVLDQGTVALLYGMWGSGKSFIGQDWGLSVATRRPWQGRHTEQPACCTWPRRAHSASADASTPGRWAGAPRSPTTISMCCRGR